MIGLLPTFFYKTSLTIGILPTFFWKTSVIGLFILISQESYIEKTNVAFKKKKKNNFTDVHFVGKSRKKIKYKIFTDVFFRQKNKKIK